MAVKVIIRIWIVRIIHSHFVRMVRMIVQTILKIVIMVAKIVSVQNWPKIKCKKIVVL